eukprot:3719776-Rhodomonas_salina.1
MTISSSSSRIGVERGGGGGGPCVGARGGGSGADPQPPGAPAPAPPPTRTQHTLLLTSLDTHASSVALSGTPRYVAAPASLTPPPEPTLARTAARRALAGVRRRAYGLGEEVVEGEPACEEEVDLQHTQRQRTTHTHTHRHTHTHTHVRLRRCSLNGRRRTHSQGKGREGGSAKGEGGVREGGE